MPALQRRATIYADIQNVVVSTDAIVASRLERYFFENKGAKFFFVKDIDNFKGMPGDVLRMRIMANKKNHNFLLDYFDWTKVSMSSDIDPMSMCDYIYKEILKMGIIKDDILENPDISAIMTGIGQSFHILCKDKNLNTVYLYQEEYFPEEIIKGLSFFYTGDPKIKFVTGDKKEFFKDHPCDSYMFEDCVSIDEYICFKHKLLSEVLIPGTDPNLSIIDQEKYTKLRLPSTHFEPNSYKEKFNLEVHTIGLPI